MTEMPPKSKLTPPSTCTASTASTAIVKGLIENDVDTVFGLPGAQMYDLFDAFYQHQDQIRVIGARHEQALGYMAFGYARSSGKLGVFSPVPGPGVLNTTAALCTAYGACAPTLCLTGEVPTSFKGQGRGHLHELPDQLNILKGLTKWAAHVDNPEDTPRLLQEAIHQATTGRQGPASLQLCWDDLGKVIHSDTPPAVEPPKTPSINTEEIDRAITLLKNAKAPMIFVGSGAQHASAEITELAELLDAPVVGFRGGRGIVSDDHELGLTIASAYKLWPDTDVMIGIGTRLEIPFIRWGSFMTYERALPGRQLLRLDIDAAEMDKLDTDAPVIADAADGAQALVDALIKAGVPGSGRRAAIRAAKTESLAEIQQVQPQMDYLQVIRDVLPRDGFLVEEVCQMGFAASYGFPVYHPRRYVSCGYQGNLGFGFPTALGVKVAHPDKAVISIAGDGGFMFGVQELATAVQYNIPLVTLVFNNHAYGNVRRDQQEKYDSRVIGSELVNPDFVQLGESFGVTSFRVASPADLKPVLEMALSLDKPVLIEVTQARGSEVSPWKFLLK
ncbi:thiamine pyrophosphate-dependent enzyme [Paremcibacter congregatus]|nr:thiamine pyrophosphate-dependent enzyme [Paremcibacter congregatus]